MRNGLDWALRISSIMVILSGYLALATVRGYLPFIMVPPLIVIPLMPICERLHRDSKSYGVLSKAITIAYGCFIPLTVLIMDLLSAVIALVIFIQLFLALHQKTPRFYYYIFLMSFFLLLAAAVQSPEPTIALVLILFLVSAVWAFAAVRIDTESRQGINYGPPDLVPLNATLRATDPGERRPVLDWSLSAAISGVAMSAIVLTAGVFFITPRVEAGMFGRTNQFIKQTGLSQSVDLQGGAYVKQDPTPVMRVEFPEEADGTFKHGPMYWRVTTLPYFASGTWLRRGLERHYEPDVPPIFTDDFYAHAREQRVSPYAVVRGAFIKDKTIVTQQIYMDEVPNEGVPGLDLAMKVELTGEPRNTKITWDGKRDFTVSLQTARANNRQMAYTVHSVLDEPTPQELREAPLDYSFVDNEDMLMLTEHDLLADTLAEVERIVAPYDNNFDKVQAIETYLNGVLFQYTLDIPPMPVRNTIDEFIMRQRKGHCEFFASALALMARSQGIPARVVSGFRGGQWVPSDASYIVRASMAHLWVEVLFPEYGWVKFDPAPQGGEDDLLDGSLASITQQMRDAQLKARMLWFQEVVGFDRGLQVERLRALPQGVFSWFTTETPTETSGSSVAVSPWRVLGAVAAVIAFIVIAALWYWRRNRAEKPLLTPDQARAVRFYTRLQRSLRKAGIDIDGLTAEELEEEAEGLAWTEDIDIPEVVTVYNEVRFGGRPLQQDRFEQLLQRLRTLRPAT